MRIPNLLLRKHVAGVEKTSDGVQSGWSSRTQHPLMASSMRIPHKSYQQGALAGGGMRFPQWRKRYQQTPQSRKRCNKPTGENTPEQPPNLPYMPLKPGAKARPKLVSPFPPRHLTVTGREERRRSTTSNVQKKKKKKKAHIR